MSSITGKFVAKPVTIEAHRVFIPTVIKTLEGEMQANPGDWIITGLKGEQYPCHDDVFRQKYDAINRTGKSLLALDKKEIEDKHNGNG